MINRFIAGFAMVIFLQGFVWAKNGAPVNIAVYADASPGDSINTAIGYLFGELSKSGNYQYTLKPAAAYHNNGVALMLSSTGEKLGLRLPSALKKYGPEGIYISCDGNSVVITGNTALALQEAVYIYLEQLGFRYFMPGQEWQVIPSLNSIYKKISILTHPDYEYRSIACGHGFANSKKIETDFYDWYRANRLGGAFNIWLGHAYNSIVLRNASVFKEHPEYFAQQVKKGELPTDPKFNVANKDLVSLVVNDALQTVANSNNSGSPIKLVSMEPSDGGGFCTTPACNAIGSVSDQVFYLANEVAKALEKKYPGVWVGSYAYNEHILPTKLKLEPNIFVMITNGFNNSKYNTNQLLQFWNSKVKKLGVYEYLSVYEWDNDMPGRVVAAKTDYDKQSIQQYYKNGARAYLAESVMGWVNRGPGQYLVSKLLWDTHVNTDSVMNDFYYKAFGDVSTPIRHLYETWENYPFNVPNDNDLADWLNTVNDAYQKTKNDAIKTRIDQLKTYIHYLVLYSRLSKDRTKDNLLALLQYARRNFETPAFATLPTMVSLPGYSGFPDMGWYGSNTGEWKNNTKAYSNAELQSAIRQDMATIKKLPEVTNFSKTNSFVKLSEVVNIPNGQYGESPHTYYGVNGVVDYVIKIGKKSDQNYFEMISGLSAAPNVDRNVSIKIYPLQPAETNYDQLTPALSYEQSKRSINEKFTLANLAPGFYMVKVDDVRKMFVLKFSPVIDYSIVLNAGRQLLTTSAGGLNVFYFYVPKGTNRFRVYKSTVLKLQSPSGRILDYQNNKTETINVEVQAGESGIWTISAQAGSLYLEGVPPYLGSLPGTMLVPGYLKK